MYIPDSIRIGGIEYEVQYQDNLRNGTELCYGYISYDDSTITLSTTDGAGHQHQCITLWHEILHGIQEHSGIRVENEEEVITMFAKGIYQVLADNIERLFDLVVTADAGTA